MKGSLPSIADTESSLSRRPPTVIQALFIGFKSLEIQRLANLLRPDITLHSSLINRFDSLSNCQALADCDVILCRTLPSEAIQKRLPPIIWLVDRLLLNTEYQEPFIEIFAVCCDQDLASLRSQILNATQLNKYRGQLAATLTALYREQRLSEHWLATNIQPIAIIGCESYQIKTANQALAKQLGYSCPDKLYGKAITTLIHPTDVQHFNTQLEKSFASSQHFPVRFINSSGSTLETDISLQRCHNFRVPAIELICSSRRPSPLVERRFSQTDPTTSLLSEAAFINQLQLSLEAQLADDMHLLLVHIHNYSLLKAALGQHTFSNTLGQLSDVIKQSFPVPDCCGSISQNSIAVLSHQPSQILIPTAEYLLKLLVQQTLSCERKLRLEVSMNLCSCHGSQQAEKLVQGLQQSATSGQPGRINYRLLDSNTSSSLPAQQWLNRALTNHKFSLKFQHTAALKEQQDTLWLAQLYVSTPTGESLPLEAFNSQLREAKLMAKIDLWLLQHALHSLAESRDKTTSLLLTSISFYCWHLTDLEQDLEVLCCKRQDFCRRLIIAISFHHFKRHKEAAIRFSKALAKHQIRLALSDVDTANIIKAAELLSANYLVIDEALTRYCHGRDQLSKDCLALLATANSKAIETIAWKVSNNKALATLCRAGVCRVQCEQLYCVQDKI